MDIVPRLLRRIALRLGQLPEPKMRAAVFREKLESLEAEQAARLLDLLLRTGRRRGPDFQLALRAATDACAHGRLRKRLCDQISDIARESGYDAVLELLADEPPADDQDDDEEQDGATAPRALTPGTRPLTLGERKSLARRPSRDILERLLLDPCPEVILPLLDNPLIVLEDVLQIATSRRTNRVVLSQLARHRRWRTRPELRRALLRHPRLSEEEGLAMVVFLNRVELRDLACDSSVSGAARKAMRRRLAG